MEHAGGDLPALVPITHSPPFALSCMHAQAAVLYLIFSCVMGRGYVDNSMPAGGSEYAVGDWYPSYANAPDLLLRPPPPRITSPPPPPPPEPDPPYPFMPPEPLLPPAPPPHPPSPPPSPLPPPRPPSPSPPPPRPPSPSPPPSPPPPSPPWYPTFQCEYRISSLA